MRKPYGGGVRPYADRLLDEATRAARILFCDSDVGLWGVLAVVRVRLKGSIMAECPGDHVNVFALASMLMFAIFNSPVRSTLAPVASLNART